MIRLWYRMSSVRTSQRRLIRYHISVSRRWYSRRIVEQCGIPQGSVLGPIMFVIFINDMPIAIKTTCMLFADDTKLYRPILKKEDALSIQEDINTGSVVSKLAITIQCGKMQKYAYWERSESTTLLYE